MAGDVMMASEVAVVTYGRRKRRRDDDEGKQASPPPPSSPAAFSCRTLRHEDDGEDDKQASPPFPPPLAPSHSCKPRQYFLDFGQNEFSCSTCKICGLLYARGHSEDERLHACFHKRYLCGISFKGWQKERIVAESNKYDGRIILVLRSDPMPHQLKVKELMKIMEKDLGIEPGWLLHDRCKVYMYISGKKVVGCAIAESISQAYQVFSKNTSVDSTESFSRSNVLHMDIRESLQPCPVSTCLPSEVGRCGPSHLRSGEAAERCSLHGEETLQQTQAISHIRKGHDPGPRMLVFGDVKFQRERIQKQRCEITSVSSVEHPTSCMKAPVAAVCGIRGLWVSKPERRRGIATELMDAVRFSFIYGLALDLSQCAFSQPTPDGKAFAAKYSKMDGYLVYS